MPKLVFDIETVGEDFDSVDEVTQAVLTRWIKKEAKGANEQEKLLSELKDGLGFSPYTGSMVALGVLDCEKDKGVVYFNPNGDPAEQFEENGIIFKPTTEEEMLAAFWKGANEYDEFISFNGRSFDVPFMMARSAIRKIRPSKDLMSNRYLGSQRYGCVHVDLLDQLTFYGAVPRRGNLHLWTRAFGIESPKAGGVTGDDVASLFKEHKTREIAVYNGRDLRATKKLYEYWDKYLRF